MTSTADRRPGPARRPRHVHRRDRPPDLPGSAAAVARSHVVGRPGRRRTMCSSCCRTCSMRSWSPSPTATPPAIIDVLTLSFGCYHEDLADDDSDPSALTASSFATVLARPGQNRGPGRGRRRQRRHRPALPARGLRRRCDAGHRRPAPGQRRLAQPEPEHGVAVLQQRLVGDHLPPRRSDRLHVAAQAERQQPGLGRRGRYRHPAGARAAGCARRDGRPVRRTGRRSTSTTTPAASGSGVARRSPRPCSPGSSPMRWPTSAAMRPISTRC